MFNLSEQFTDTSTGYWIRGTKWSAEMAHFWYIFLYLSKKKDGSLLDVFSLSYICGPLQSVKEYVEKFPTGDWTLPVSVKCLICYYPPVFEKVLSEKLLLQVCKRSFILFPVVAVYHICYTIGRWYIINLFVFKI